MQSNYEHMVKAQHVPSGQVEARVSDDIKFQVVSTLATNVDDLSTLKYCIEVKLLIDSSLKASLMNCSSPSVT